MYYHRISSRLYSLVLNLALLIGLLGSHFGALVHAAEASTYANDLTELKGMAKAEKVLTAAPKGTRVKIQIEITIGNKGVARITDMHLSGTDLGSGRAHILAEAEVRGNHLFIKPYKLKADRVEEIDFLAVRDRYLVPMEVSRKLGFNNTMKLRRSRVELELNSLMKFEIQM